MVVYEGCCVDSFDEEGDGTIDDNIDSPLGLQQMGCILDEVQDVAEWVTAVKEVVHKEISQFDTVPNPNLEDQE